MFNRISKKCKKIFPHRKDNKIKKQWIAPEKKEKLVTLMNHYSLLFHIVLACGACFFIEWVSRHSFMSALTFVFDRSLVFLYNSFLVFASLMLVYLFRRRMVMRIFICVVWLFLGIINGCVLLKRVTPFSYTDLKMINDLFTMQSNYFTNTEAILVIIGVSAFFLLLIWMWFKGPKFTGKQHRLISLFFMGTFVFFIPMVTSAAVNNQVLASYFENIAQGYSDYGFIYSFSASVVDRGMSQPQDYTEEKVNEIVSTAEPTEAPSSEADLPNIICVLLESFVKPDEINFLNYNTDPTPNYNRLIENYSSGYLEVPVVGAGTANTEFEILTGMSMQFFGLGEYPYKTILKTNSCESIAGTMNRYGYGTHVVHNNGGNFYSRANAFSQMGFDTFTSKEMINIKEYTPTGTWPTDDCLINEVKKTMDSTPDKSDFVYTITVQGHGSYPTEKVLYNPEITVSGAETEEEQNAWEYYINQIHEVDTFIGNLIQMLEQRDEKTIVVFFGDHLPTMGLTEEDMASGSLFRTHYATWNNFGLEKNSKDLTSYQLLPYILEQAGIQDGTMINYHQRNDYALSEDYIANMNILQYDILYGNRYAYGGQDLYPASELVMGVDDIILNALVPSGEVLNVSGSNFTPWSRVFVNNEKVSTLFISDTLLQISLKDLQEGQNTIVVNQLGSSSTIFRSSNEKNYYHIVAENVSE